MQQFSSTEAPTAASNALRRSLASTSVDGACEDAVVSGLAPDIGSYAASSRSRLPGDPEAGRRIEYGRSLGRRPAEVGTDF